MGWEKERREEKKKDKKRKEEGRKVWLSMEEARGRIRAKVQRQLLRVLGVRRERSQRRLSLRVEGGHRARLCEMRWAFFHVVLSVCGTLAERREKGRRTPKATHQRGRRENPSISLPLCSDHPRRPGSGERVREKKLLRTTQCVWSYGEGRGRVEGKGFGACVEGLHQRGFHPPFCSQPPAVPLRRGGLGGG